MLHFFRFPLSLCVFVYVYHFILSVILAGAVLTPAVWGPVGVSEDDPVCYMYKYAVFDIKVAYNH